MDEIQSDNNAIRYRNKWDEVKDKLSPEDFEDFVAAVKNPSINQAAIRRVLKSRGIHLGAGTISQMRNGIS